MFHVKHLFMENLFECPKCSGNNLELFLECIDYTVSKERFKIDSCKKCGFKFTNPRPDSASMNRYYDSVDYISHSNTNAGIINKIYHLIKKLAIKNKIELIKNLKTGNNKLLDIGCGTGSFLGLLKKEGWEVTGIEPNEKAANLAKETYSISVVGEEKVKSFIKESFSIITMWHVMEHVHNLKQRIIEVFDLLEKNGFAVIAVPNYTSWDAKHFGSHWAAYDVPRHLYHFSPASIKELFTESNFRHIKSLPMKFDAYYVSMLSEKYKGSTFKLFKAFFLGMYSNIKAKNDSEKYSSVIYIFQKK